MTYERHDARLASATVFMSSTRCFSPTHAAPIRRWTAARRRIGTFVQAAARRIRDVLGPLEFSVSVNRRGFLGRDALCGVCRADVHDIGEMCPRQLIADCSGCGRELYLDYYLNAMGEAGCQDADRPHHTLANFRSAIVSEWRAAQADVQPGRGWRTAAL
jgi:hypothetical protein